MRLKLLFKAKGPQHKRTKGLDCKALVHNPFQTLKWWQWKYKFFLPSVLPLKLILIPYKQDHHLKQVNEIIH